MRYRRSLRALNKTRSHGKVQREVRESGWRFWAWGVFDRRDKYAPIRKLSVSVKRQPAAQMAHLVLPDTQADPSQNQKSHFLPTHRQTERQ